MYFKRMFKNSELGNQRYAVYVCDVCGNEEWIKIHYTKKVDAESKKVIRCPNCNSFGKDDKVSTLNAKRAQLLVELTSIQEELDNIEKELAELKEEVTEGV